MARQRHSGNTPKNRRVIQNKIVNTYLVSWVEFDMTHGELRLVSYVKMLHTLIEVCEWYQYVFVKQCDSMPLGDVNYLPMPRVHCATGHISELPEIGYQFIENPTSNEAK